MPTILVRFFSVVCLGLACSLFEACAIRNGKDFSYRIGDVGALSVRERHDVQHEVLIDLESRGTQEVSLSVSGLPANASGYFRPATGIPPFSTTLVIVVMGDVKARIYPFTMRGTSEGTPDVLSHGNVTIIDAGCAYDIMRSYTATYSCNGAGAQTLSVILTATDSNNFELRNFPSHGDIVNAKVDCNTYNISIPAQYVMSYTLEGKGRFLNDTISLDYTLTNGTGKDTCHASMVQP